MAVSMIGLGDMQVSRIIPGLMRLLEWQMTPADLNRWIHECLEMGINIFDHADIYGSYQVEAAFGEALRLEPGLRDQLKIVTKCGIALLSPQRPHHTVHHYDTSKAHILQSVNRSLQNFGTDRLDVLLIHRPDPLLDADEVADALTEVHRAGKVLNIGVSNFPPHHFDLLQSRLALPLITNQIELSVAFLDPLHDGTLDQAQQLRRPPMVWSPMGGGALFQPNQDARLTRLRTTLERIAGEVGATADQVALAWVLKHPARPLPVLGTGKIERIRSAVEAEKVQLDRQQWFALWEASAGHEVP